MPWRLLPYIRWPVRILLVVLAAVALSAGTYLGLERLGRRAWPAIAARAVAWAALGLLLLNVSCPRPPLVRRPIVIQWTSPRITAHIQTLLSSPISTSPMTWALVSTKAVG